MLIHDTFRRSIMDGPPQPNILERARSLADDGEYSNAIEIYQQIVSDDPQNSNAWYCMGVLQQKMGLDTDAIESFTSSDQIYPNYGPTLANLAFLLRNRSPTQASEYAKAALVEYPENEQLIEISSLTVEKSDDSKIFVESFPAEPRESSSFDERMIQAETLSNEGEHGSAVALWKSLLEGSPKSPEVWRGLSQALLSAGHQDRAEQCRLRAENLEDSLDNLAQPSEKLPVSDDASFIAAAEAQASQSVELPNNSHGGLNESIEWYNMGLTLLNEENSVEALTCFEKAIGGCPREEIELRVKAQIGRGNALYKSSRYNDSVIAYHAAISMDPDSITGRTLFNMGSSYAAVELYQDAVKCFSQALQLGLDKDHVSLCGIQLNRCRLLSREQEKRQARSKV
ncbi:MAG TPA: tetratricopeptide repeat protein [Candidatus Poseidoniales archaeon]|nr:MAG TPA: tetratricopeptide repeat protein [Candidatus Poseidoniales archaeon]|tara:strand:+ start:12266 stop:13462 length:1197 start_codon:yes stop_codon:yes gene_type:complete